MLTPSAFSRVFQQAIPATSPYLTLLARQNDHDHPRLGITVPKKKVKKAVQRNRIKRCARESFRLRAHELPNIDIIFIAKNGIGELDNKSIHEIMNSQWMKLLKRCKSQEK